MYKNGAWLFILLFSLVSAGTCLAESISFYSLGARIGTNDATDKKTNLKRYEVFGIFNLPWTWDLAANIDLETRFYISGGMLDGEGDSGFIGTLGPGISFTDSNRRFSFELSGGIVILSDYRMGNEDFGGPVQFSFDIGIGIRIYKHLGLGYRFQHFSDAAVFGTDNRGVDMHMLEVSYRFLNH